MVRCPVVILNRPLRIALLSYRSKPHCGGQGVYVRHLSRELVRARAPRRGVLRPAVPGARPGSGAAQGAQPGPVPRARPVPDPALGRVPRLVDVEEFRDDVGRRLPRAADLQHPGAAGPAPNAPPTSTWSTTTRCWATGMLGVRRVGLPLVTSIHHPISVDRRIDLASPRRPGAAPDPAALVRLRPDAGPGGPAARRNRVADHRVRVVPATTSPRLRGPARARAQSSRSAWTRLFRPPHRSPGCRAGSWRWPAPTRR